MPSPLPQVREHLLGRVAAACSARGGGPDAEQRQLQALLVQTEVSAAQLQELLDGADLPESERRALAAALEREGEACFVLPPAAAAELATTPSEQQEALAACAADGQAFRQQLSRLVWGSPAFSAPQVSGRGGAAVHCGGLLGSAAAPASAAWPPMPWALGYGCAPSILQVAAVHENVPGLGNLAPVLLQHEPQASVAPAPALPRPASALPVRLWPRAALTGSASAPADYGRAAAVERARAGQPRGAGRVRRRPRQ